MYGSFLDDLQASLHIRNISGFIVSSYAKASIFFNAIVFPF